MQKQMAVAAVIAAVGLLVVRAQDSAPPQNQDVASLIKAGDAAVRRADFAEADVLYAKAASQGDRPEIAQALWYLGARAAGQKNRLAAEGFFERLIRLDPMSANGARALTWLANMHGGDLNWAGLLTGNTYAKSRAEAEEMYKKALEIQETGNFDSSETARAYAVLLRREGRVDEADAMEQRARAPRPGPKMQGSPLPADVYRVGGGVSAPSLLSKVEPQYTEEARATKIQGTTVVGVDIGPDGIARNFEILRSLEPGLDTKAIEAIQRWRFKPGTKDGAPVTVRATIEVNFRLM
jgi:TonB family protein